jgi:hypothetical protein
LRILFTNTGAGHQQSVQVLPNHLLYLSAVSVTMFLCLQALMNHHRSA